MLNKLYAKLSILVFIKTKRLFVQKIVICKQTHQKNLELLLRFH